MTSLNLFDRSRIRANQARAAASLPERDFLHRHAAQELATRLAGIKRTFEIAADIGAHHGVMARQLAELRPALKVISLTTACHPLVCVPRRAPSPMKKRFR